MKQTRAEIGDAETPPRAVITYFPITSLNDTAVPASVTADATTEQDATKASDESFGQGVGEPADMNPLPLPLVRRSD